MDVSVAVCTYNGEDYLNTQLDSILNQTLEPNEIVVCDDGSTDNTVSILESHKSNHPELFNIFINENNIGITKNFEKAIRKCQNDAIALCDQDDMWYERKLEYQVDILSRRDCDLVFHNSAIVSESLDQITNHWDLISYEHGMVQNINKAFSFLMKRNYIKGSTILFDKSLRKKVTPIPEPWGHDWYIAFIALLTGNIIDIDKQLHKYRRHDDQASSHNTDSIVERISRGITTSSSALHFEQRASQWEALKNTLSQFEDNDLTLSRSLVLTEINDRYHYERNRRIAHDPKMSISKKIKHVFNNYTSGRYQKYGNVPDILCFIHDMIMAVCR